MIPTRRAGRHPFSPGPPPPTDEQDAATAPDLQQTLYVLIVQQWARTLTGPYDWGDWPLGGYFFGEAFHKPLERHENINDVAWLCAMVACGLADECPDLEIQPRPAGPSGGQLARDDGAKGYRCTIVSGRGAGARLDFWRLPSSVIEFDTFTAMRLVHSRSATTPD
jgi:hypothetical protein